MATRTIKSAAGKSDPTAAAVRTVVRQAAPGVNEATRVAGRSGAFSTGSRNDAGVARNAPHAGAAGAKGRKY